MLRRLSILDQLKARSKVRQNAFPVQQEFSDLYCSDYAMAGMFSNICVFCRSLYGHIASAEKHHSTTALSAQANRRELGSSSNIKPKCFASL
jgi:hypothetical protein